VLTHAWVNGVQMDLLGRMREPEGARGIPQRAGPPLLEQLEPRLLLSADLLGAHPLTSLGTSLNEQAVLVNLNQKDDEIRQNDSSLVLTCLASVGEADPSQADLSDGSLTAADTKDANPGGQPLEDILQPAQVNEAATGAFAGMPLRQVESAVQVVVESEGSAAPVGNESAGPIVSDRHDSIAGSDGFPIAARGPPAESCNSLSAFFCKDIRRERTARHLG